MASDSTSPHNEDEASDDEREVTPVGQASKALLELSTSNGDQNTRAYQAPRELLDLARRQQAKRAQARAATGLQPSAAPPAAASLPPRPAPQPSASLHPPGSPRLLDDDAAPPRPIGESSPPRDRPTHRPGRSQRMAESSTPSISVESISGSLEGFDSASGAELSGAEASGVETPDSEPSDPISVNDAAPSVARSRPSRSLSDDPAPSSASSSSAAPPASLSELARAANDPDAQPSIAAPSARGAQPDSAAASSARQPQRMPLSVLVMIISICLLIGFVLAKWRGIELLLPHR